MLLAVKLRNAAELFWDSLDAQERQIVAYALAWLAISAWSTFVSARRERLKAELREEILGGER